MPLGLRFYTPSRLGAVSIPSTREDLNQEVARVSIELAEVLTQKGEAARAADLAAGCYSIMRSWGLHKDALAAWIVFQNALGSHRGSCSLV